MCLAYKQYLEHGDLLLEDLAVSCRYHKKQGERYTTEQLIKDYGCLELFNVFYPYYLSIIYGGRFPEEALFLRCPSDSASVAIKLVSHPVESLSRRFMNNVKRLLWRFYPTDYMLVDAGYEVLSVEGKCPCHMKPGQEIQIKHSGSICPAVLYAIGGKKGVFPDTDCFCCPSDVNMVRFCHAS